jgi:hypothetical protein
MIREKEKKTIMRNGKHIVKNKRSAGRKIGLEGITMKIKDCYPNWTISQVGDWWS